MAKKFYLKERHNPQLKNPYYFACGQLTKKEAKDKEKTVYGLNIMIAYETEKEYNDAIQMLTIKHKKPLKKLPMETKFDTKNLIRQFSEEFNKGIDEGAEIGMKKSVHYKRPEDSGQITELEPMPKLSQERINEIKEGIEFIREPNRDRFNAGKEYALNMAETFIIEFVSTNRPSVTIPELHQAFSEWADRQRKI